MITKSTSVHAKCPTISVVVIGRNSFEQLQDVYHGEYLDFLKEQTCELIYVDSGSTDESVEWMRSRGFDTVTLLQDGLLSAAAGRNIGTQRAQSEFVLYLDSDMKIHDHEHFFSRVRSELNKNTEHVGLVGQVVDHYPDGTTRVRVRKSHKNGTARTFGGFVILRRSEVISAGNWNSGLASLEEQELYSRLLARKKSVLYVPDVAVQHKTQVPNAIAELISVYWPTRGKRYGGLGKALRDGFWQRRTIYLLLMNREVLLFAMVLGPIMLGKPFEAVAFFIIYEIDLLVRRSWKYNLVVPGLFVSTILGLASRKEKAKPYVSQ